MSNNTILYRFRGLASTILHEQSYTHEHIESQLAHTPRNAVSGAYNHALYWEPRARMMQEWADFLEQTQRGVKVLPFRDGVAQTLYSVRNKRKRPPLLVDGPHTRRLCISILEFGVALE